MTQQNRIPDTRRAPRMEADREELAECIARALPEDGAREIQPTLHFRRHSQPTRPVHAFAQPALCAIAQGAKVLNLGAERLRYDPAHYLITTMELPLIGQVVEATPARPYLSFRLVLDPAVVASVMVEAGLVQPSTETSVRAANVSPLDAELLDAILRLCRIAESPAQYRTLAPLIVREIIYRLLTGAQSHRMRHLATTGGQAHRMVRAVQTLRDHFDKPLRIEGIARDLGMSVSGFHAHFKAVTAMSPLQFQKHLRLQEARRLMLSESLDASQAGFRVGYEDASQFNREYKRHFGAPPKRDVEKLREFAGS
ncbi:MAG: AraC family transcriptional regulator N-terminal domain-containing protein [Planctomycetota bacterium]